MKNWKDIAIKTGIIGTVFISQVLAEQNHIQYINIIVLLTALFISIYYHEKFFPLFSIAIVLFLMATVQELYSTDYINLPITLALHLAARMMFASAIIFEVFKSRNNEAF